MDESENLFVFRRFLMDEDQCEVDECHKGAIDKLQTLYPGKKIIAYDMFTIGVETDSLYSDSGTDTYELGKVDWEIPAVRNTRNGEVITFR